MSTDPTTVRAARLLISQLGLTPEDLMWVPTDLPTFRDYVPRVIAASGTGAKRTYSTYWTRITETFGDKRLDEVTPSEIEALMRHMVDNRRVRRNDRGGHSVAEHLVSAMRAIYTRAINDNLLPPHHNPAAKVPKPRRRPTTRHGLSPAEVTDLADAVTTSGHDAVLDTLLFRLHLETACRRGGALALREDDIEPTTCLIQLREKNATIRWQPASPTLIASLLEHRHHRGNGKPTPEPLLRHRNGDPINHRRYDRMWQRLGDRLPWVAARNVSTHWLRHTTLTCVERHYGPSITRGYAGHAHPRSDDVTAVYTKPTVADLATALAAYTPRTTPSGHHSTSGGPTARLPYPQPAPAMTERPTPLFSPPEPDPSTPLVTIDTRPRIDHAKLLLAAAAIDHSGRIPARRLLRALDWHPDQGITARLRDHAITVRLDVDSPHRIDSRHHVFIPAGLRDLTGIRTGDSVALLGAPQLQLLIIYPVRALTTLLGTPVD